MTSLEAANRALALLGVAPISSLSAGTEAARVMSRLMDGTKRAVLEDFPWAVKKAATPEDISTWPAPLAEYFVTRLASDAALSLTGSAGIASMLWQKSLSLAGRARENSVVSERPKAAPPGSMSYLRARD